MQEPRREDVVFCRRAIYTMRKRSSTTSISSIQKCKRLKELMTQVVDPSRQLTQQNARAITKRPHKIGLLILVARSLHADPTIIQASNALCHHGTHIDRALNLSARASARAKCRSFSPPASGCSANATPTFGTAATQDLLCALRSGRCAYRAARSLQHSFRPAHP